MQKTKRLVADAFWITAWLLFHAFVEKFRDTMPKTELGEAERIKEEIRKILNKNNIYHRKRAKTPENLKDIVCAGMIQEKDYPLLRKKFNRWLEKLNKPWRV